MPSPRTRRPPRHRRHRERSAQAGLLLQGDGSHHDWLQGRGPHLVLHAAIDDATSDVPAAVFREQEDAFGYLVVLRDTLRTRGIPMAIYGDRHGILTNEAHHRPLTLEEQLHGVARPLTQVGRALAELHITWIPAASPQAKGRIERLGAPFRIAWSVSCAGPRRPPSRTPTASWPPFSRATSALHPAAGRPDTGLSPATR